MLTEPCQENDAKSHFNKSVINSLLTLNKNKFCSTFYAGRKNIPSESQKITKLKGVKLINGRSFYVTQNGNSSKELQPQRMVEDRTYKHFPAMARSPLSAVLFDTVYEIRKSDNDTWEFLVSYMCKDLALDWLSLKRILESSLNRLIEFLKQD